MKKHLFTVILNLVIYFGLAQYQIPAGSLTFPCLIELTDGSSGSGFICTDSNKVYLATAKHVLTKVVEEPKGQFNTSLKTLNGIIKSYSYSDSIDVEPLIITLEFLNLFKEKKFKVSDNADILVIELGEITKDNKKIIKLSKFVTLSGNRSIPLLYSSLALSCLYTKAFIGNDVFMFGFPKSLGLVEAPQFDFDKALLRKGVLGGKNNKNKTLVIDCPSYQGNSGGPVYIVNGNQLLLLGIVTSFIPFVETWTNDKYPTLKHSQINNSGYSIVEPIDKIIELINSK